ncbi:hypothetical protein BDW67DRAFT_155859, partial [Aspergillus spinulosporus]
MQSMETPFILCSFASVTSLLSTVSTSLPENDHRRKITATAIGRIHGRPLSSLPKRVQSHVPRTRMITFGPPFSVRVPSERRIMISRLSERPSFPQWPIAYSFEIHGM